jgi:hypothetical protein
METFEEMEHRKLRRRAPELHPVERSPCRACLHHDDDHDGLHDVLHLRPPPLRLPRHRTIPPLYRSVPLSLLSRARVNQRDIHTGSGEAFNVGRFLEESSPYLWASAGIGLCIGFSVLGAGWRVSLRLCRTCSADTLVGASSSLALPSSAAVSAHHAFAPRTLLGAHPRTMAARMVRSRMSMQHYLLRSCGNLWRGEYGHSWTCAVAHKQALAVIWDIASP